MATGQSQDAGWQIGVRKTFPVPAELLWDYLTSPGGIATWLGPGAVLSPEKGAPYVTDDGTVGEIRSFHPGLRIRMTHRPAGWSHDTTLQLTVRAAAAPGRATLGILQEWLSGPGERERQREHWRAVVGEIEKELGGRVGGG